MRDKIDEMFEIIGNNKKSLIFVIIAYVIISIIVIVAIWWPKAKDYATYPKFDMDSKKTEQAQGYINTLSNMLKNGRKDEMKSLISSGYIAYTGKSAESIVSELESQGFFSSSVTVSGMSVYTDGNTYVYTTTAYAGYNSKAINIIERYPYKYEIVFDDFYSYDNLNLVTNTNNIVFTIGNVYRNLKYIEFNISIENLNDVYARFDFNSIAGVQAVLEDGTKYSLSNLISEEAYTNIESNMTLKKNLVFEIPAQLQEGIKYILFNGVSIRFSDIDIKVNV